MSQHILFMLFIAIAASACQRTPDPAELDRQVQEEQADGARKVAEAERSALADSSQRELPGASPGVASESVLARDASDQYRVALEEARAQRKVAETRCKALDSDARAHCEDTARRDYEVRRAQAQKARDAPRKS